MNVGSTEPLCVSDVLSLYLPRTLADVTVKYSGEKFKKIEVSGWDKVFYIFLTIITLGYWNYKANCDYKNALEAGNWHNAALAIKRGANIDNVQDIFVELITKNKDKAASFLISQETFTIIYPEPIPSSYIKWDWDDNHIKLEQYIERLKKIENGDTFKKGLEVVLDALNEQKNSWQVKDIEEFSVSLFAQALEHKDAKLAKILSKINFQFKSRYTIVHFDEYEFQTSSYRYIWNNLQLKGLNLESVKFLMENLLPLHGKDENGLKARRLIAHRLFFYCITSENGVFENDYYRIKIDNVYEVIKLLLNHGANIDEVYGGVKLGEMGRGREFLTRSPLEVAISTRNLEMVKFLLENKATPTERAFNLAVDTGDYAFIEAFPGFV